MGLLNIFSRKSDEDKLEAQRAKLAEAHETLKIASVEVEEIKNLLVRKANGSLYPHLANAGVKLREI